MKLKLEINSRAINDTSRALEGSAIMITPPIDEEFWLFRVRVSEKQAVVGFPKFSVIGIGFQHEVDWNTNLPSGGPALEIYEHIKRNKGDARIPRGRCLEAILMIQEKALELMRADAIDALRKAPTDAARFSVLTSFLCKTGNHKLREAVPGN